MPALFFNIVLGKIKQDRSNFKDLNNFNALTC